MSVSTEQVPSKRAALPHPPTVREGGKQILQEFVLRVCKNGRPILAR